MPQRHFVLTQDFANTRSPSFSEGLSVLFSVRRRRVSPERGPDWPIARTPTRCGENSVRPVRGIIQALSRWPALTGASNGNWNWTLNHPSPGADAARLTKSVSSRPARGTKQASPTGERTNPGGENSPRREICQRLSVLAWLNSAPIIPDVRLAVPAAPPKPEALPMRFFSWLDRL